MSKICNYSAGKTNALNSPAGTDCGNLFASAEQLHANAFAHQIAELAKIESGSLLKSLRAPQENRLVNRGKTLTDDEKNAIVTEYSSLTANGFNKKNSIEKNFGKIRARLLVDYPYARQ